MFFPFINALFLISVVVLEIFVFDKRLCFFYFEIIFSVFFILLFLRSIKKNGLISVYTFFLFFSVFFLFGRFLFDIFGYADVLKILFPSFHQAKPESGIAIIVWCFYLYQIIDFGYSRKVGRIKKSEVACSESIYKLLIIILLFLLPFVLYKSYLRLRYVQEVGFIQYKLTKDEVPLPVYLKGVGWAFNVIFWTVVIASQPNRKIGIFWILMLVVSLVDSMKGDRAAFAINLVLCVYFMLNRKKISKKKLFCYMVVGFILFIVFYLVVTSMREASGTGNLFHKTKKTLFMQILGGLFYDQTVSLNIPLLYFDNYTYMNDNHFIPFVLVDTLKFNYGVSIPDQGMLLREVLYTPKGYGLGYCFLLELFDLKLFSFFFAYLIGKFMKFININFYRNYYCIGFFALFFMGAIYMPRHIFLDFSSPTRLSWIFAALIVISFGNLFCKYGGIKISACKKLQESSKK